MNEAIQLEPGVLSYHALSYKALDPFNPEQKWNDSPVWQKTVLFTQLALVAVLFAVAFLGKTA
jgi:hypothetical protein